MDNVKNNLPTDETGAWRILEQAQTLLNQGGRNQFRFCVSPSDGGKVELTPPRGFRFKGKVSQFDAFSLPYLVRTFLDYFAKGETLLIECDENGFQYNATLTREGDQWRVDVKTGAYAYRDSIND